MGKFLHEFMCQACKEVMRINQEYVSSLYEEGKVVWDSKREKMIKNEIFRGCLQVSKVSDQTGKACTYFMADYHKDVFTHVKERLDPISDKVRSPVHTMLT